MEIYLFCVLFSIFNVYILLSLPPNNCKINANKNWATNSVDLWMIKILSFQVNRRSAIKNCWVGNLKHHSWILPTIWQHLACTYHVQFSIVWMWVLNNWIIGGSVVGYKECPSSEITPVLVTTVQHITMEKEGIPRLHFNFFQWENLWWVRSCIQISLCC